MQAEDGEHPSFLVKSTRHYYYAQHQAEEQVGGGAVEAGKGLRFGTFASGMSYFLRAELLKL